VDLVIKIILKFGPLHLNELSKMSDDTKYKNFVYYW